MKTSVNLYEQTSCFVDVYAVAAAAAGDGGGAAAAAAAAANVSL